MNSSMLLSLISLIMNKLTKARNDFSIWSYEFNLCMRKSMETFTIMHTKWSIVAWFLKMDFSSLNWSQMIHCLEMIHWSIWGCSSYIYPLYILFLSWSSFTYYPKVHPKKGVHHVTQTSSLMLRHWKNGDSRPMFLLFLDVFSNNLHYMSLHIFYLQFLRLMSIRNKNICFVWM